ncbi:hypothetical protein PsYK624_116780 [Phanerochaete sordida]|uniref:Uncharacterized protein n=1 Tax=Phanerochaete sordida TaxID=48140 RepID=A0A9P3GGC1_9APHY|nr:hypothetical protein PsYK624_116780 [Phanerochaete sordida]
MTSSGKAGGKRPRSSSPGRDEPQTPVKRVAYNREPRTPSSSLTPEQRSKRLRGILDGLSSVPTTPTRRETETARSDRTEKTSGTFRPAGIRGPFYPDDPLAGSSKQLAGLRYASSAPPKAAKAKEIDSEEEFWSSPPPQPVARPPRGEFSAAGYRLDSFARPANNNPALLTPQSSPHKWTGAASLASTAEVDDLLAEDADLGEEELDLAVEENHNTLGDDPDNPFDTRAASAQGHANITGEGLAGQPLTPLSREYVDTLNKIPAYIERLERKLRAAERSVQKKQERIYELETRVAELEKVAKS